jgi:hypothetical protein
MGVRRPARAFEADDHDPRRGAVRDLVEKMLKTTGRRVDLSTPFADAMLPDGLLLHVAISDIVWRHWSLNIRKFDLSANSLDELGGLGTITPQAARLLEAAVQARLNIIGGRAVRRPARCRCSTACALRSLGHRRAGAGPTRTGSVSRTFVGSRLAAWPRTAAPR